MLGLQASKPQAQACRHWADDVTEQILFGGAKYGGKSYLGANLIFSDALTYPDTAYFIARQQLNDLRKHTVLSIKEVFDNWGLKMDDYVKYNGMDNYFECLQTRSPVFFIEGKELPSDPLFERFGSQQYTRGWIEEGGEFADLAIENLSVTVGRKNNKKYGLQGKLLITANPKKNILYRKFYKPWSEGNLPANLAFVRSLATDNVNGDQNYIRKLSEMRDPTMRARLWLGDWEYDEDPATLMQWDAINDLWTNDHVPVGKKYISADVARYGHDLTVIALWEGLRLVHFTVMEQSSVPEVAAAITQLCRSEAVPRSHVVVDDDGIGGGVVDLLPGCVAFKGGARPIESKVKPQNFANLKTQCSYVLSEHVNDREVYIATDKHRDKVAEELSHIKRDKMDNDGPLRILGKEKVKEALGRSPDFADVLMMRMVFELREAGRAGSSLAKKGERVLRQRHEQTMRERFDPGYTVRNL